MIGESYEDRGPYRSGNKQHDAERKESHKKYSLLRMEREQYARNARERRGSDRGKK